MDRHYEVARRRAVQRVRRKLIFRIHAAFYGLMLLALIVHMIGIVASQNEAMRVIGITLGGLLRQYTYTVPSTEITETITQLDPTFDVFIAWAFLLAIHWAYVGGAERLRVWWQRNVERALDQELAVAAEKPKVRLSDDGELASLDELADIEDEAARPKRRERH